MGEMSRSCQGLSLLMAVVGLWVGSGTLIQYIEADLQVGPIFLTCFSTSLFTLLLPPGIYEWHRAGEGHREPIRVTAYKSARFGVLWFLANAFFNLGLKYTSVASSSVMSSMSSGFVLFLSWIFLKEDISASKVGASLLCASGIIVVSVCDSKGSTGQNPVLGDVLTLGGALCYGLYSVFLKGSMQEGEQGENMPLFFGLLGAITSVALIPVLLLADLVHLERVEDSMGALDQQKLIYLLVNGLLGTVLSDLLWAHSVRLLGPVIPAVGLGLTIPTSMLLQVALGKKSFSIWYACGAALTLGGFALVAVADPTHDYEMIHDDCRETDLSVGSSNSLDLCEKVPLCDVHQSSVDVHQSDERIVG